MKIVRTSITGKDDQGYLLWSEVELSPSELLDEINEMFGGFSEFERSMRCSRSWLEGGTSLSIEKEDGSIIAIIVNGAENFSHVMAAVSESVMFEDACAPASSAAKPKSVRM